MELNFYCGNKGFVEPNKILFYIQNSFFSVWHLHSDLYYLKICIFQMKAIDYWIALRSTRDIWYDSHLYFLQFSGWKYLVGGNYILWQLEGCLFILIHFEVFHIQLWENSFVRKVKKVCRMKKIFVNSEKILWT